MRTERAYLAGLTQLHQVPDGEERRGLWRQAMASLAAAAANREPAPLEGLSPAGLLAGVRTALDSRLIDDLSWLSPAAAAVAVYELAAALPAGNEKRELGRRVLSALHEGDGTTFVALATSLALTSRRPLAGQLMRARVALALESPASEGTGPDALALAMVARRDLEREWLGAPSTAGLPSRRLAARLLERAARETVRRLRDGDESNLAVFSRAGVRDAWHRLIADRESLVWRHVAAARGLLAHAHPAFIREIDRDLAPSLEPTRWRRAATSLGAMIAADRDAALTRCRAVLAGELPRRDPGVMRALLVGLGGSRAVEPEACEQLAAELIEPGGLEAVEAVAEVRRELDSDAVLGEATVRARAWLAAAQAADDRSDDGRTTLYGALDEELAAGPVAAEGPIAAKLRAARIAARSGDVVQAILDARDALGAAAEVMVALEQTSEDDSADRRHAYRLLRELELNLLESGTTTQIIELDLAATPRGKDGADVDLAVLHGRMERWLLGREATAPEGPVAHPTMRIGRLRALVRLMDAEAGGDEEGGEARTRRVATAVALLRRAAVDRSSLRRATWAAVARAWDALLRDEIVELSDLVLGIVTIAAPEDDFAVLREATMMPEVADVMGAWVEAARAARSALAVPDDRGLGRSASGALLRLARALPAALSARVEAFRTALLRLARALDLCAEARALAQLRGEGLERLGSAAEQIAHLLVGARRRLELGGTEAAPESAAAVRMVSFAVERALRTGKPALAEDVGDAAIRLNDELPAALADGINAALARLARLPCDAAQGEAELLTTALLEPALPAWLPPGRTIGGFYLHRPIGTGAGGSVFVASRADERHEDAPELFALKVPDYDGGAARSLSEEEFENLFREEARALLALPAHPNIAHFVTFDARAKPKPILVMELVAGPSLEHVLAAGGLSTRGAIALLDGIAAGLEAMHDQRVAHLDVKPANIILRTAWARTGTPDTVRPGTLQAALVPVPVLVDFGLAGRKLRPGCGSPHYGAPEVWSQKLAASAASEPFAADVYAFSCLAWEILTGHVMVTAESMIAVVAQHLSGQAGRRQYERLAGVPGLRKLAEVLGGGLHHEARQRPTMRLLRAQLAEATPGIRERTWPLLG